ncbi:MAG: ubiquitin-like domain-containing protein [Firmicutes bacterium]|nr:ubiquitin-like domain-containing protein [Bacillota bacterium]
MAKQLKAIPKRLRITLILLIILLSFTNVAKAYEGDGKNVRVNVDGESRFFKTAAVTVGDLFETEEIEIEDLYQIDVDPYLTLQNETHAVVVDDEGRLLA